MEKKSGVQLICELRAMLSLIAHRGSISQKETLDAIDKFVRLSRATDWRIDYMDSPRIDTSVFIPPTEPPLNETDGDDIWKDD